MRLHLTFSGPCIVSILLVYFQQDATLHSLFISGELLYMFREVSPPVIRSTYNCIYSIWYLSNRYCYLPLLWKSWNWFECDVGIVLICFGAVADVRQQPPQQITPKRITLFVLAFLSLRNSFSQLQSSYHFLCKFW